jgi:uncharacterized membrane protein YciS (DUF1049 family)
MADNITNIFLGNMTNASTDRIATGSWLADIIINAPAEISSKLSSLITILQIAGLVLIGYIIFLIIKMFFRWRRHVKIDKTYELVKKVNHKLDILLENHEEYKKILKKEEKKEEKTKVVKKSPISKIFSGLFKKNKRKKSKKEKK